MNVNHQVCFCKITDKFKLKLSLCCNFTFVNHVFGLEYLFWLAPSRAQMVLLPVIKLPSFGHHNSWKSPGHKHNWILKIPGVLKKNTLVVCDLTC